MPDVRRNPAFAGYERETGRLIPVVVLERTRPAR